MGFSAFSSGDTCPHHFTIPETIVNGKPKKIDVEGDGEIDSVEYGTSQLCLLMPARVLSDAYWQSCLIPLTSMLLSHAEVSLELAPVCSPTHLLVCLESTLVYVACAAACS